MTSAAVKQLFDIQSLLTRAEQKLALGDAYGWTEIFEYAKQLEVLAADQAGEKLQDPIALQSQPSKEKGHPGSSAPEKAKPTVRGRSGVE